MAPGFPLPQELLPQGQVMFALQILHTCAMPLVKASILAFYSRIFDSRKWFKAAAWILTVYIFVWWLSILFATIFQCSPVSDNWVCQTLFLMHHQDILLSTILAKPQGPSRNVPWLLIFPLCSEPMLTFFVPLLFSMFAGNSTI